MIHKRNRWNVWQTVLVLMLYWANTQAQEKGWNGYAGTGVMAGTKGRIPFWLLSDQYGKYSPKAYNVWMEAGLFTDSLKADKIFDYEGGMEGIAREDGTGRMWLQQAYAGGKLGWIRFWGGLREEHFGTQDPELSSGFVIWSGNARPIPKISIGIPEFQPIPFTKGFAEFKGELSHGWFGKDCYVKDAYLHHKYLYLRFGGKLPIHLFGGLSHFAQWGGLSPDYGPLPSGIKDYIKVFFAQSVNDSTPGVPSNEWENRYGNHLGSRDIAFDYTSKRGDIFILFWQNFIEDITGLGYRNIGDGLWGLQWRRPGKFGMGYELIRSVTYKNLKMVNGKLSYQVDNYFNNSIYKSGWTYDGYTIGTSFITSPLIIYNQKIIKQLPNNRVIGHVLTGTYNYKKLLLFIRYSFTRNYGSYALLYDPIKYQNSLFVQVTEREFYKLPLSVKIGFSIDRGSLIGNHLGMEYSMRWNF